MYKSYKQKRGFTLPELMVAMAVMVMVIFSATNLVVSILRSNTENINTMVAYGLAQEGVEAVRNIRDSNWLLGAKFDGELKGTPIWGDTFEDLVTEEKFYIVDIRTLEKAPGEISTPSALAAHTPWILEKIKKEDFDGDKTTIKMFDLHEGGDGFRYGHLFGSQPGKETQFHRYLIVRKVQASANEGPKEFNKMRVSSVVEWMEQGRPKVVRLDTELTDWYQGQ